MTDSGRLWRLSLEFDPTSPHLWKPTAIVAVPALSDLTQDLPAVSESHMRGPAELTRFLQ